MIAMATSAVFSLVALTAAASAAPEWDSEVFQAPTNLPPGGRGMILIIPSNVGPDSSTASPTVSFELPAGVTVAASDTPFFWSCTGSPTVTCTNALGFAPMPPSTTHNLFGGAGAPIRLTVALEPDAPQGSFPFDVTVSGAGGDPVTQTHRITVGSEQLGFGLESGSFAAGAFDEAGNDFTQAGGHPYQATASFKYNTRFIEFDPSDLGSAYRMIQAMGAPRDVVADLPAGFVGDPTAVPTCPDLGAVRRFRCPAASQVGVAHISPPAGSLGKLRMYGVYNVEPAKNHPAEFAFRSPLGLILMVPSVRSNGDWGVRVSVRALTEVDTLFASRVTLWGVPADPRHDSQRCAAPNSVTGACVGYDEFGITPSPETAPGAMDPHAASVPLRPFLTNPTECSGSPVVTGLHLSEWATPAPFDAFGDPDLTSPGWHSATTSSPPVTGCEALQFNPSIEVSATTGEPGAPTGLDFELEVPQNDDPNGLATAHLRNTTVTLPEGMTVNPSSADGLDACSSAQIGLVSRAPMRFDKSEPSCPQGSKIGSVEVDTPLLDEPLTGEVFLARQADNPFDSLLAIYLVVRGPGVIAKLAGHVEADSTTGRLSTTVVDNPQIPFSRLSVSLKGGPRAPLTMPEDCGPKTVSADLSSWAGHVTQARDSFQVACPGRGGFAPRFSAGSTNPIAGDYSPLVARFTRDGGDVFSRIETMLPDGMLAKLKGVGVCSNGQLATAPAKSGRSTQAGPACPLGSQVGTVTVGAGAGSQPFYPLTPGLGATGRVFLTEAHSGVAHPLAGARQAAYGLAFEVPAVAGPFDLGTVLVRAAIYVDETTAKATVVSDPLPTILQGIPLNVRDIRVDVDRADFARNPTDCSEKQIAAVAYSAGGARAALASRFEVSDCQALSFAPRIGLRLTGRKQTRTGRHPGVRAVVTQRSGEAGIERAEVRLPSTLALDPDNAQALCEYADGIKAEPTCPKGSIVGRARAVSPLLNRPLVGNVYFVKNVRRSSSGKLIRTLPMIVVALRGEVAINLRGLSSVRGKQLVNTFAAVPDAPISRFNLNIKGGRSGILVVTDSAKGPLSICGRQVATANVDGHNGKRHDRRFLVKTPCKRKAVSHKL